MVMSGRRSRVCRGGPIATADMEAFGAGSQELMGSIR